MVTPLYASSPVAAPRPVTSPLSLPSASVRLMQRTPMEPTEMAMQRPIMNPLLNRSGSISGDARRE